jgi:hypothetical protein
LLKKKPVNYYGNFSQFFLLLNYCSILKPCWVLSQNVTVIVFPSIVILFYNTEWEYCCGIAVNLSIFNIAPGCQCYILLFC